MKNDRELKCIDFVNKRINKNANLNEIDRMLSDISIDLQNDNGDTLLLLACKNRDLPLIEYLVKHNANANIANKQGVRPLKYIREEIKKINRRISKVKYFHDFNSEYHLGLINDYKLLLDMGSIISKSAKNKLSNKEESLSL